MKSQFKKKTSFVKALWGINSQKTLPELVHSRITRIDINFIADYLHVFNIFLMNS